MKEYYFLCSLPRAGNTLLGSILNQSKDIKLTANSILPEIIYQLYLKIFHIKTLTIILLKIYLIIITKIGM